MIAGRIRGAAVIRPGGDLAVLVYAETPDGIVLVALGDLDDVLSARDAEDEPR